MFDPVLILAIAADWFTALILAAFWCARREIRGRVLPFCILTLLHALPILPFLFFYSNVLMEIYLFSPLVLLLFGMICTAALSELSRMTRHLGISCFVFFANIILQGLLVLVFYIGGYCG